jgi:hypothetical protein
MGQLLAVLMPRGAQETPRALHLVATRDQMAIGAGIPMGSAPSSELPDGPAEYGVVPNLKQPVKSIMYDT